MNKEIAVGISVEESATHIAVFTTIRDREPVDTFKVSTTNCFAVDIKSIVQEITEVGDIYLSDIAGIGLVLPGPINSTATKLERDDNLTDWVGRPLRYTLKRAFRGTPVALGNHAQGQALAEAMINTKLNGKKFLLFSIGTSLEATRVSWTNGQPRAHPVDWSRFDTERNFDVQAIDTRNIHWFKQIIPWFVPGIYAALRTYPAEHIILSGKLAARSSLLTVTLSEALEHQKSSSTLPHLPEVIQPSYPDMGSTAEAVRLLCNAGVKV